MFCNAETAVLGCISAVANAAGDAEDIGMFGRRRSSARRSAMACLGGTSRNYDVSAIKSE